MAPRRDAYLPQTFTFVPDGENPNLEAQYGVDPATADPQVADIHASPWNVWGTGTNAIATSAVFLLAIVFALGVSFVTAEVTSGALGLWLTFEPRRQRVYWSKAVAAALGTLPFTVVGLAALVGTV